MVRPQKMMLKSEGQESPSQLSVEADHHRLTLQVPARGPHRAALTKMGGAVVWLVVCASGMSTALRAGGGMGAVALSLPFWLLGLVTTGAAAAAMLNSYCLEFGGDEAVLTVFPWRLRRRLKVPGLRVRLEHVVRGEADGRGGLEVGVLVLESGKRRLRLLEGFSEREQRSIQRELEAWLSQRRP